MVGRTILMIGTQSLAGTALARGTVERARRNGDDVIHLNGICVNRVLLGKRTRVLIDVSTTSASACLVLADGTTVRELDFSSGMDEKGRVRCFGLLWALCETDTPHTSGPK